MYEKLKELAEKLKAEGRVKDAELVFAAMLQNIPDPEPTYEKMLTAGGISMYSRAYL